jgi:large subunit ribosomal protein L9
MRNQLLLVEDVDDLGRSGDIVSVKPGFARNFLLPQSKAVVADKFTLRMQAKLQKERAERAAVDRQEAESLANQLEGKELSIEVKVDPDGHMYGSVAAMDIVHLLEKEGIQLEKRNVALVAPIKTLGSHPIQLKLKEGVPSQIMLHVYCEGYIPPAPEAEYQDIPQE